MRVLDIGGGFTAGQKFGEAASTIRAALRTYFPDQSATSASGERDREAREGRGDALMTSAVMEAEHGNLTCVALACNSCRSNPTCKGAKKIRRCLDPPAIRPTLSSKVTGYRNWRLTIGSFSPTWVLILRRSRPASMALTLRILQTIWPIRILIMNNDRLASCNLLS